MFKTNLKASVQWRSQEFFYGDKVYTLSTKLRGNGSGSTDSQILSSMGGTAFAG